jgi:hypothetical protein
MAYVGMVIKVEAIFQLAKNADYVTIGGIEHGRKAGIDYDSWQFSNFDGR